MILDISVPDITSQATPEELNRAKQTLDNTKSLWNGLATNAARQATICVDEIRKRLFYRSLNTQKGDQLSELVLDKAAESLLVIEQRSIIDHHNLLRSRILDTLNNFDGNKSALSSLIQQFVMFKLGPLLSSSYSTYKSIPKTHDIAQPKTISANELKLMATMKLNNIRLRILDVKSFVGRKFSRIIRLQRKHDVKVTLEGNRSQANRTAMFSALNKSGIIALLKDEECRGAVSRRGTVSVVNNSGKICELDLFKDDILAEISNV